MMSIRTRLAAGFIGLTLTMTAWLLLGRRVPEPVPLPPIDSADFVRDSVHGGAQPFYLGWAGNGVFLGAAGDAPEAAERKSARLPSVAFGDFWDENQRTAVVTLSLDPTPGADDPYWQALDIDTGLATTYWQSPMAPIGWEDHRVDTVVTPDGVICWRIRTTRRSMRLSVCTPLIRRDAWRISGGVATARLHNTVSEAVVSLQVTPASTWRFAQVGRGAARREVLQADLGRDTFVALAQRAVPLARDGTASPHAPRTYTSFEEAARLTRESWSRFWAGSKVNVPDADLAKWYRRSLYYLGAMSAGSTYPPGPMGPNSGRWGGRIFGHDTTYMHAALLSSNHPDISGGFIEWYLSHLADARRVARENYGLPGARYGWEQNSRGAECAPEPFRHEHHVNADIAWQAWRQVEWTGDPRLAERIIPLLRDTATFLAAHLQWDEALHGYVSAESTDLDEEAQGVRGAVATQTAAAWLAQTCYESGAATEATAAIRGRVYLPHEPTSAGAALTAYVGDHPQRSMKHPSPILPIWPLGLVDPDSDLARRALDAALTRVNLNRTPTFNRPWLATVAARMHDGERAAALLSDLLSAPGCIVDDTCFVETQNARWPHFLTTCGALVAAVNEMLLQCPTAGLMEVFPAIPASWQAAGVSFETLLARGGVEVSGRLSPDQLAVDLLRGGHPMGEIVLDLPAIAVKGKKTVVAVDGVPVGFRIHPRERMEVYVPPSTQATRHIRVTTEGGERSR